MGVGIKELGERNEDEDVDDNLCTFLHTYHYREQLIVGGVSVKTQLASLNDGVS